MKLEELKKEAVEELEKIFHEVPPCSLLSPETKEILLTYIDKASKCIELPEEKETECGGWIDDNARGYNQCLNDFKKLNNINL